jgi:dihydroneopterin aldolase
MQLLVSVADAMDAAAAVEGGADIVDAKDPSRGALGPVSRAALGAIVATVAGRRPVSAALGDDAPAGSLPGVAFVKLSFASLSARVARAKIVLAAYADARDWHRLIEVATRCNAYGVLLDTSDKNGPGLFRVLDEQAIGEWVDAAHAAGLTAALAGRLTAEDLPRAAALGADIAGVRGAACEGGRSGRVSVERVRALSNVARRGISPTPAFL